MLLIPIGSILLSLEENRQKPFYVLSRSNRDSPKLFCSISPKISKIDPMGISNTNINMHIAHLLSPKWSLYDFRSPSYINLQSVTNGRGQKRAWPWKRKMVTGLIFFSMLFSTGITLNIVINRKYERDSISDHFTPDYSFELKMTILSIEFA